MQSKQGFGEMAIKLAGGFFPDKVIRKKTLKRGILQECPFLEAQSDGPTQTDTTN
jgi:hypothetical protein